MRSEPSRIDRVLALVRADRALAPVVSKAMEAGIVVLYIGLLVGVLYGNVVPGYRTAAGVEVGERALATAAERVQQAVPPAAREADARYRVDLPRTIRGRGYHVRADGRTLVLDHPHPAVAREAELAVPDRVVRVEGAWSSREPAVVRVYDVPDGGLAIELVGDGDGRAAGSGGPAEADGESGGRSP